MWVMAKRKRRTPDRGVKRPKGRAPARRQPGAVRPALCVVAVCLCLLLSLGDAWGKPGSRLEFSVVVPGLEYAHLRITNQPWSVHIARLERARPEFGIVSTLGRGVIQGLSPLSAQARSVPPAIGRPVAAVNGDFFLIHPGPYQGDPKGLQILNGELVSTPGQLSFWAAGHELHIDPVASAMAVTWPDGTKTPFGLNQTPQPDTAVLFTPIFGPSTRATNQIELTLEKLDAGRWLPLRASRSFRARVRSISMCGDTRLEPDIAVLTLGAKLTKHLNSIKPAAVVQLSTALSKDLGGATVAIGGGPMLVHNGRRQQWPGEKGANAYLLPRHPRTALGFNARYFFLVEVDGRQKGLSVGMSFVELASFMKKLGCSEAMNLDGGGSATFWLDGKVMNSPSDKQERALANALVIVLQKAR